MEIIQRFKEPSSWAGIAILLNWIGPVVGVPAGTADLVVQAGTALAALAAFVLKEKA